MNAPVIRQIVHLHRDAPPKPAPGAPCNGCGVCCAAETCPAGLLLFMRKRGPCPALTWNASRYHCGLLIEPRRHLAWLPAFLERPARQAFRRWIAAGIGCDSPVAAEPADTP